MPEAARHCTKSEIFKNECLTSRRFVCSYDRSGKPASSCSKTYTNKDRTIDCRMSFNPREIPVGTTISFRFPPGTPYSSKEEKEKHALGRIKGVVKAHSKSGEKYFFRLDWNSVQFIDSPDAPANKVEEIKKKYFGNRFYSNLSTGTALIENTSSNPLCFPVIYNTSTPQATSTPQPVVGGKKQSTHRRKTKCIKQTTKKYKTRPGPAFSASKCKGKKN